MAAKWNKTQTVAIVRQFIGPFGRVWERDGVVSIGWDAHGKKFVLGSGANYEDAIRQVFLEPLRKREEAAFKQETAMKEALAEEFRKLGVEQTIDPGQE